MCVCHSVSGRVQLEIPLAALLLLAYLVDVPSNGRRGVGAGCFVTTKRAPDYHPRVGRASAHHLAESVVRLTARRHH
jgi:hypothetical protein